MANLQLEAQVRQRVAAMGQARGWTQAQIDEQTGLVLGAIDMAAAGDTAAGAVLQEMFSYFGIQQQAAPTPQALGPSPTTGAAPQAGGGSPWDLVGQVRERFFGPGEATMPTQVAPMSAADPYAPTHPAPSLERVPGTNVGRYWVPETLMEPGHWEFRSIGAETGGGSYAQKIAALAALEQAMGRPLSDYERARYLLGFAQPSGGGGGMTAYQAAQLGLAERRLGGEEFQQQIQAAQTAQPLSYLAMLRGQVPGAGGTDIYQGLRPVVPTLAGQQGAPGLPAAPGGFPQVGTGGLAGQWQAPPMPPAMATVQRGAPLGQPSFPQGTLRTPGLQAQARMTPYETGAMQEAAAYQGIPGMDWRWMLERSRRAVGPGLARAGYGGRIR